MIGDRAQIEDGIAPKGRFRVEVDGVHMVDSLTFDLPSA